MNFRLRKLIAMILGNLCLERCWKF